MSQALRTDIEEAREALDFWSRRAERLPWHRRAARREAREMASRWRARLVRAQLERWRLGWLGTTLLPLMDRRPRLRRSTIGRLVLVSVAAMAFACVATSVLLVVAAAHLAGLV